MPVEQDITVAILEDELERARPQAEDMGWKLDRLDDVSVKAALQAPERVGRRETYVFEFRFDDYRAIPPLIDVVHPETGERNISKCFPDGQCLGYFHGKLRICADWSRRSYKEFGGPHPEWGYGDWVQRSGSVTEFGLFLHELWRAIHDPTYLGRSL